MKSLIFVMFFSIAGMGFSQTYQNGLIIPNHFYEESFEDFNHVFASEAGFDVYDGPNGNKIGLILQNSKPNLPLTELYSLILSNGKKPIYKYFDNGLTEVGYEIFVMSFFKSKDGYVKIFDSKSSYWIKIADIEKSGFHTSNWQDYLVKNGSKLLGYYAKDLGLNLRETPTTDGKVLKTLRGNLFEIELKPETDGNWNKVKVIKYQEHPCKGNLTKEESIEYILEGWIKTVDDNGIPNVRYYARGC